VLHFVGGFAIGLLTGAVLFLYKKISRTQEKDKGHRAQLEELSKLTGRLAHEIKNPLSTIKLSLELVREELEASSRSESSQAAGRRDEPGPARACRKIAVIQKETDRLEHILEDFLTSTADGGATYTLGDHHIAVKLRALEIGQVSIQHDYVYQAQALLSKTIGSAMGL